MVDVGGSQRVLKSPHPKSLSLMERDLKERFSPFSLREKGWG
jgi:hypothetical protein